MSQNLCRVSLGDKVTLLLNGRELETKSLTEKDELKAEFMCPMPPASLRRWCITVESKSGG
jgi:hypothetical protein